MYLPNYINELSMEKFIHTLDDTTECYKFYWFNAILEILAKTGKLEIEYDEIINEMIADAWYSVSEYHLHLGLRDSSGKIMNSLERAVNKLMENSDVASDADKDRVLEEISKNNQLLKTEKTQIGKMVPYRFLSPFLKDVGGDDKLWDQKKRLIAYIEVINKEVYLPYKIIDGVPLKKRICINNNWAKLLTDNYVPISGWIRDKKLKYLQDRNPGVPGIVYKLAPMSDRIRKLKQVRVLWNNIIHKTEVQDIYSKKKIIYNEYDIDHFIPWSYIANDELWNLIPMDSALNSSKSNKLPIWDDYFGAFADTQYLMYRYIYTSTEGKTLFEKCKRDNLYSIWGRNELYVEGHSKADFISVLEYHLKPVYDSAQIQGYDIWKIIDK